MIRILPKQDILDPQGKTIHQALHNLGFHQVQEVRMGKQILLSLPDLQEKEALDACEKMCKDLLVNPLTETYALEILTS